MFPGDGSGPYNVPAALSQGDGPPQIRPYHTIIELSDHRWVQTHTGVHRRAGPCTHKQAERCMGWDGMGWDKLAQACRISHTCAQTHTDAESWACTHRSVQMCRTVQAE